MRLTNPKGSCPVVRNSKYGDNEAVENVLRSERKKKRAYRTQVSQLLGMRDTTA